MLKQLTSSQVKNEIILSAFHLLTEYWIILLKSFSDQIYTFSSSTVNSAFISSSNHNQVSGYYNPITASPPESCLRPKASK